MSESLQRIPDFKTLSTENLLKFPWYSSRSFEELARRATELSDEQLQAAIDSVTEVGDRAFWLRGIFVAEAKRRIREAGAAMQGKRDVEGKGITAAVAEIAKNAGVTAGTLEADCQIVESLMPVLQENMTVSNVTGETVILPPAGMSREICLRISREKDPDRAVRVALELITPKKPAPTVGEFMSALDKVKRKELRLDSDPPTAAASASAPPAGAKPAAPLLSDTELFQIYLHHDVVDRLIFISDSEAHASISTAIEWCIEQVYRALNASRDPNRRPGDPLPVNHLVEERAA